MHRLVPVLVLIFSACLDTLAPQQGSSLSTGSPPASTTGTGGGTPSPGGSGGAGGSGGGIATGGSGGSGGGTTTAPLTCAPGCPSGFSCSNGVCVGSANPIVLDVKTHSVSYRVTLNGSTPSTTCTGSDAKTKVRFTELESGWSHTDVIYCSNTNFSFNATLPEGTYSVSLMTWPQQANLPVPDGQAFFVVQPRLEVKSALSNVVLDVKTHAVAYRVTLNGATPATTCTGSSAKARVRFSDAQSGFVRTDDIYCSNAGFSFSNVLPEGNYAVAISSWTTTTNLPVGDNQEYLTVLDSLAVKAAVQNLVLDVRTRQVQYRVTLNGATPTTTCTGSYNKVLVRFARTEGGWSHTGGIYCSNANFTFGGQLPVGIYAIWIEPMASSSNLPVGDQGGMRIVGKLEVK